MAKKKINQPLDIEQAPAKRGTKILASGAVYDLDKGRIVAGSAKDNPWAITKENTHELKRKRQEKTAALLRQRITETHNASMPHPVRTSAGAFAEAGAMLYEQIVLNSESYDRDRMEAWSLLGKHAGVLGDPRAAGDDAPAAQDTAGIINAVTSLIAILSGKQEAKPEIIDVE